MSRLDSNMLAPRDVFEARERESALTSPESERVKAPIACNFTFELSCCCCHNLHLELHGQPIFGSVWEEKQRERENGKERERERARLTYILRAIKTNATGGCSFMKAHTQKLTTTA